jgi:fructan beta-fructosidase
VHGDSTIIGYDGAGLYFIDRRHAGIAVGADFDRRYVARRISTASTIDLTLYVDASSIELFADGGLSVMTALVFPSHPYTQMVLRSADGAVAESWTAAPLSGIHN